ncbi:MAG: hypothetical protein WDO73_17005 [Ignavibacteriota bacterium]
MLPAPLGYCPLAGEQFEFVIELGFPLRLPPGTQALQHLDVACGVRDGTLLVLDGLFQLVQAQAQSAIFTVGPRAHEVQPLYHGTGRKRCACDCCLFRCAAALQIEPRLLQRALFAEKSRQCGFRHGLLGLPPGQDAL